MEQKITQLIEELITKYGTENQNAALAGQALATLLGDDKQVLFDMIEAEPESE